MKTLVCAWPIVVISLIGLLASLEAYTVIIDPGHGGSDPGAVRPGAYEKQLTLSTSVMLAAELRRLGVPYVMTRYSDETCSLISRRDLAARYPGSVFVSIHYNAAQSTAASGIETFYHGTSGRALGAQVQRALIYMTGAPNRGLKKRGFKVLAKNPARAAILVEGGFISNAWERRRCQDPRYQLAVAQGIVMGLVDTFGRPKRGGGAQQLQTVHQVAAARPTRSSRARRGVVVTTFSATLGRRRR